MLSSSSYNTLGDPAGHRAGINKSRKRIAVIALSSVVLIAVILTAILATNHSSGPGPANPTTADSNPAASSSLRSSIKALCSSTLYPDSCYTSLASSAANSSGGLDPASLFLIAVNAAKMAISSTAAHFNDPTLQPGNKSYTAASISDCRKLLSLALSHIDGCISDPNFASESVIDDLKTWLSAAITDQHTCMDGLDTDGLGELVKVKIEEAMRNSTELTSNGLSILTQIADFVGSVNWMSAGERRLLSSSWGLKNAANVVVAQDGSGKYKTISAALAKVPTESSKKFVIYVKKGVYYENVVVEANMWNVVFVGDGMESTVVSAGLNFVDGTPTFSSATFAVFGKGFVAVDMAFRNTAGPAKQQAVALLASADLAAFYRCKFDANQDTLYVHSLRQFYRECNIFGTVDFIFGNAAVVFQTCNILPRLPIPGQQDTITAQGKVDPNQNTGISIHNCTIWPAVNLGSVAVYLGRPWKPYSTTVYMRTTMAGIINPAGWLPWNGLGTAVPDTIFYSEYQNYGPGSILKNRVKWKGLRVMDSKQAGKFTVRGFIGGNSWLSKTGIPYSLDL
ncbi:putative pectinesterase/pectinesterase inhibitor 46 [Platanthera zijinensis]|uniref:Pectinesterase n=1 Tax=Platanthera zijinensis TaxID=2320716 RepID=A0AAP0B0T4_9ASPA